MFLVFLVSDFLFSSFIGCYSSIENSIYFSDLKSKKLFGIDVQYTKTANNRWVSQIIKHDNKYYKFVMRKLL